MSIDRRGFIRGIGGAGVALAAGRTTRAQAAPASLPNILYILTDQQTQFTLGAYGNSVIHTPNLDALAARGCTLDCCYLSDSPSSPSRAAQYTGLYGHNNGVVRHLVVLDESVPCLGDICSAAGYDTAYFGKWMLGGYTSPWRTEEGPRRWHYVRLDNPDRYRWRGEAGGLGEDYPQHGFETWAGGWLQYQEYLEAEGLDEFLALSPRVGCHAAAGIPSEEDCQHIYSAIPAEHHVEAFSAGNAEAFIRSAEGRGRPWCCVLSFYAPHPPVSPPRPWDEMYALSQTILPGNHTDTLEGKPIGQRTTMRRKLEHWTEDQFRDLMRRYWGYISYIDDQIGRVFQALTDTGRWRDTIVVFTSDHGDMNCAHGAISKSCPYAGYEEYTRVPLLVHAPGVTAPGRRSEALVSHVDILPTLLDICGIAAPGVMDGRSFTPVLRGAAGAHRDMVFGGNDGELYFCRDAQHKLVMHWWERDVDELYDLTADPLELANLAESPDHQTTRDHLRGRILDWLGETDHPYAAAIGSYAEEPTRQVLSIEPRVDHFRYLGGARFEISILWTVAAAPDVGGQFQCRLTAEHVQAESSFEHRWPPATPLAEWEAGKEYRTGPVAVDAQDAADGEYALEVTWWDDERRVSAGIVEGSDREAILLGALRITRSGGEITDISLGDGARGRLSSGTRMVSLPVAPDNPDPRALGFGEDQWVRWNPEAGAYVVLAADAGHYTWFDEADATPGRGYWAKLDKERDVLVRGSAPPPGEEYAIEINPGPGTGWVQIGCPAGVEIPWRISGPGCLRVRRGALELPLGEAKNRGWCEDYAWAYSAGIGYRLVHDSSVCSFCDRDRLAPWEGYWFCAHEPCELVTPPVSATAALDGPRPAAEEPKDTWRMAIQASLSSGPRAEVILGQARGGQRIHAPPPFEAYLQLSAPDHGLPLAVSLRDPGETPAWALQVSTDIPGAQVALTWPDLSRVPRRLRPVLVDLANGKRRYMRTCAGYTYTSAAGGGIREFAVEMLSGEDAGALAVVSLLAVPAPAGTVDIRVNLSAAAAIDVEVLNIAGRRVGVICTGKQCAKGLTALVWSGHGRGGRRLPSGRYLIRVTARAEDGRQAGGLTAVQMRR